MAPNQRKYFMFQIYEKIAVQIETPENIRQLDRTLAGNQKFGPKINFIIKIR